MSHDDRGAYTPPSEPPLTFDARRPVRGSTPMPTTLIASAVLLVLLVGAVFLFYRNGARGPNDAPQPVGTPAGETRSPAPPEQQTSDPAAGLQIYKADAPPAAPTFVPPPEEPMPRPAPGAAPVAAAPLPAPKAAVPPPAPVAAPPPPKSTPAPAPAPVIKAPAPPAPKTAPAPAATPAPKAAPGGAGTSVQIGAFSSPQLADRGWNDAARIAPGAAAGRGKRVEPVEVNGSTLYRTFVTGFASRADAEAFCAELKAAGKSCFVR